MKTHHTAVIDPGAELHDSVVVGPYAVVEKGVKVGPGSEIGPHAFLCGRTTIGARNRIGAFASIGAPPQDLKYLDEETEVIIGDDNQIREYVSIHRGTPSGHGFTRVGNGNLLMAYVHIAHDCTIGDRVIMANAATLGGHVEIEDRATIGGLTAVHQFSRIGSHAYVGGMSGVSKDIPPYVIAAGIRGGMKASGINRIGLKRHGFSSADINSLVGAFKIIFRTPELLLTEALDRAAAEFSDAEPVRKLVAFFRSSKRGVVRAAGDEE